jgi:hypothetical protein
MPTPPADRMAEPAAPVRRAHTPTSGGPYINPATGLSTDYLNHFAEVVMILEMSSASPECLNDLRTWQPKTYVEHFATSHFSNREQVIAAYRAAKPSVRESIDGAASVLNDALIKTRDIVLRQRAKPDTAKAVQWALSWLKPLIGRTAAVINGTGVNALQGQGSQAAVDAIFTV